MAGCHDKSQAISSLAGLCFLWQQPSVPRRPTRRAVSPRPAPDPSPRSPHTRKRFQDLMRHLAAQIDGMKRRLDAKTAGASSCPCWPDAGRPVADDGWMDGRMDSGFVLRDVSSLSIRGSTAAAQLQAEALVDESSARAAKFTSRRNCKGWQKLVFWEVFATNVKWKVLPIERLK